MPITQRTRKRQEKHASLDDPWMEDLGKKGILVGGEPLQPVGKQINGYKKVVTDGPLCEAK
jgi:hypothetical protein